MEQEWKKVVKEKIGKIMEIESRENRKGLKKTRRQEGQKGIKLKDSMI